MNIIKIVLPMPSTSDCHGNKHWRSMREARKSKRDFARIAAIEAMNRYAQNDTGCNPFPFKKCEVYCEFHFGNKRKIDGANAKAAMKPYFDGFTDAGLWLDDNRFVIISESQRYFTSETKESFVMVQVTNLR